MKKLVVILMILVSSAFNLQARVYDFNKSNFGDTMKQVRSSEAKLLRYKMGLDGPILFYHMNIDGAKLLIRYHFNSQNLFAAGTIKLLGAFKRHITYLGVYKTFKDIYLKIFGKPQKDVKIFKNNIYKNRPNSWVKLLFKKQLEFKTVWKQQGIGVYMRMYGHKIGPGFHVIVIYE